MKTPDEVRARLRALPADALLDEYRSSIRSIATTQAMFPGVIPEHEFIGYNVFRLELPLVEREIHSRIANAAVGVPIEDTERRALNGLQLAVWACRKPHADVPKEQLCKLLAECLPYLRAACEGAGSIPSEALTDDDWQLVADATDCIVPGRVCEAVNNLLINRATVRAVAASDEGKP